ncbi:hypothetical protein [Roseicyclus persicicus]|uniref:Uncharacterized protein n=1 Tax=Roseicyclus persicicus TaxID=2650661 RepID=A0A7X6H060_9RHOB|nr:hypothetical protein [Roseibacterium persicicum]NKX45594.1 hypothetical protein [Roseibacterium persicicum]
MSGFLRPEAAAVLRRWREVIAALGLVALGLWIATSPGPVLQGAGYVLAALAAIALVPAIRRARFAPGGQGPGVVRVVEGRILYMGPVTGGAVSVRELTSLSLRRDEDGRAAWVLTEPGQLLVIPVDAAGAEALFDAFTALPGLGAQRLLSARQSVRTGTQTLWRRQTVPALTE